MTVVSAALPGRARHDVLATRAAPRPTMKIVGVAAMTPASSLSRRAAMRCAASASRATSAAAAPKPAMPATFSVPPRRRRSWPPPLTKAGRLTPSRTIRRADAARSAELMRGNDQRVGAELGEVQRQAPGRLHRVDVQRDAVLARHGGGFRDRLNDTRLVVGHHHAEQHASAAGTRMRQRTRNRLQIDDAVLARRQRNHLGARRARRGEHRVVLDRRNADGLPAARHHTIIGFRCAAGEHDLARLGADQRGDLLARGIDHGTHPPALGVHRRRVADRIVCGKHRRARHRPQGR